jgi:type I restriction enzyme, S subunit
MRNVWPQVPLGEVLTKSEEWIDIEPTGAYREITVRLWGKGVTLRREANGSEIASTTRLLARAGQYILSRIDARNGALGLVPEALDGAVVSNDFPTFAPNTSRLLPAFLDWMTKTRSFVEICKAASEGTTNRVRLQEDRFLKMEIPLPPLLEQRRIVARIEALAAQIHEACDLRQKAVAETEALLNTTRRLFFETCLARTVELQDVCSDIIDNLHSNPHYADSGLPCVRSPDVGYGTLNLEGALRTDEDEYHRRTIRGEPKPDDIVLVREGGGTGKCALVLPGQRFSLGQRVMMLRLKREAVVPKFFLHQLLSPFIQEDQIVPLSKGSASPHLNIGALKKFSIRLPSLSEQEHIAAELDSLQVHIDAIKKIQAETAGELDALLPSILDKAFKGEL